MHTRELFSLSDRVAIVTGGRGLYGASISRGLAEMGATVVVASRNGKACEDFAAELRKENVQAIGLTLDLGNDASIRSFVDEVICRYGHIDILVNNAVDRRNMTSLADATRQKLQDSANVNLNGQILLSQAVLEHMIPANHGSIIFISSMRGLDCPHFPFYPPAMQAQPVNYTTEKWAMIGLTKYMAGCYGKHHIRVNCIAPGVVMTDMMAGFDEETLDELRDETPLNRLGTPEDIAEAALFLCSDKASFITGQILGINGGFVI